MSLVVMYSMSDWSQHLLDAERAWEENRKQYLSEIYECDESPNTKNKLRNAAEWVVEIAVRAEKSRALNHMRSLALIKGGEEPTYDLGK